MTLDSCARPRNFNVIRFASAIALAVATLGAAAVQAQDRSPQAAAPLQWQQQDTASRPTARHENGFVSVAGRLILVGRRGDRPLDIHDPKTGLWTQGEPPPFEIHHLQGVDYQGKLYLLGALTGKFPPQRRRGAAGVAVHEGINYLVGGNRRGHMSGYVNWLDAFDPASGRWTALPDAPHARDHFHAAVIDGKLVVIGGESMAQEPAQREVEAWDPATARWQALPPLPVGRHGTQAATLGDQVYIAAGSGKRGGGLSWMTSGASSPARAPVAASRVTCLRCVRADSRSAGLWLDRRHPAQVALCAGEAGGVEVG